MACQNERCIDPCPGSCGINAQCTVINHNPVCTCLQGFIGDALRQCDLAPVASKITYSRWLKLDNLIGTNWVFTFQLRKDLLNRHHASHHHVVQMQNAVKGTVQDLVYVLRDTLEIHMTVHKDVAMSVK